MAVFDKRYANVLLPAVFFGYAIFANAEMLMAPFKPAPVQMPTLDYYLEGGATKQMDALYKTTVPHRDLAVGAVGAARYALLGAGRSGVVVGHDGWLFTKEEFAPISDQAIKEAVNRITKIRDTLRESGTELVIVPLAAKADVYSEHLGEFMSSEGIATVYRSFSARLESAGIVTVDSRAALVAAKPDEPVFLHTDTHWTPGGARAVADAIAVTVASARLQLDATTVTGKDGDRVDVWGDLTRYITSPAYAGAAGLTQETVAPFRAVLSRDAGASDLFGEDVQTSVVLIGTSYSANENWSFIDFIKMSLSADVLNMAKEGLGPGIPMLDLLASDTMRESPPSLVIWEFPVRYLDSKTLWRHSSDLNSAKAGNAKEDKHA